MYKVSKNDFFGNCWPLMEHGPHWASFIIFTFVNEKNGIFKCLYKIERGFISFDMKERKGKYSKTCFRFWEILGIFSMFQM
jgi:hypothetical protein